MDGRAAEESAHAVTPARALSRHRKRRLGGAASMVGVRAPNALAFGLAAFAGAILAGCGGSGGFAARADGICARHQRQLAALPEPMSVMEEVRVRLKRVDIARDEVADLRAVVPASDDDAARLVATLDREVDALERLRIASITGDSEEAEGALYQGRKALSAVRRAAAAVGVKTCARGA